MYFYANHPFNCTVFLLLLENTMYLEMIGGFCEFTVLIALQIEVL